MESTVCVTYIQPYVSLLTDLQDVDPAEVQKIVDSMQDLDALEVEDVLALFQAPGNLKISDAEHKALTRVFGGIRWEESDTWVSLSCS